MGFSPSHRSILTWVTSTHVYYGVEFDADGKEALHVYSVKTDGSGHELFYIPSDMEELNPAAYFSRGSIDNGYLKILLTVIPIHRRPCI